MPNTPETLEGLPTPGLVADMLDRLAPPPGERAAWEREFNLCYHFGGLMVAVDPTPAGHVVVASGPPAEVGDVISELPADRARRLIILTPDPLADHLVGLPSRPQPVAG